MARTLDELVASVLSDYVDAHYRFVEDEAKNMAFWDGSPIERTMGVSLLSSVLTYNSVALLRSKGATAFMSAEKYADYDALVSRDHTYIFSVWYQVKVDNYRADFVVRYQTPDRVIWIAVECDGHDFHERTKEQAERDRSRDRHFQTRGLAIFRFTGSEIWRDPMNAVGQIHDFCVRGRK